MRNCTRRNYSTFILFFYFIVFRDPIERVFPIFRYADEVIAALAIPLFLMKIFEKKATFLQCQKIIMLGTMFLTLGTLSSIIFQNQKTGNVVGDIYLNLKFWLSIYVGYVIFQKLDIQRYCKQILLHVSLVTTVFSALTILVYISKALRQDLSFYKHGLLAIRLIYSQATYYSAACAYLIAVTLMIMEYSQRAKCCLIIQILLQASTLLGKSMAAICVLFIITYLILIKGMRRLYFMDIAKITVAAICAGWAQFSYYFLELGDSARKMLMEKSFQIAIDYFPLGSGFATYGSFYSISPYSQIYRQYGISSIYGLSEKYSSFLCDSFWPMILGQTGFLGLFSYILMIFYLFSLIQGISNVSKYLYLATLYSFAYLVISSTGESAFVNPISIGFGLLIGLSISKQNVQIFQTKLSKNSDRVLRS